MNETKWNFKKCKGNIQENRKKTKKIKKTETTNRKKMANQLYHINNYINILGLQHQLKGPDLESRLKNMILLCSI